MHTLLMTVIGLALLGAFAAGCSAINRRRAGARLDGALLFIGVWLVVSAVNLWVGVAHAGYSLAAELGVHAVVFGVPAAAAWYLSRRLRGRAGGVA